MWYPPFLSISLTNLVMPAALCPLVFIFTQHPLLSSLPSSAFPEDPPPPPQSADADVINGSSLSESFVDARFSPLHSTLHNRSRDFDPLLPTGGNTRKRREEQGLPDGNSQLNGKTSASIIKP